MSSFREDGGADGVGIEYDYTMVHEAASAPEKLEVAAPVTFCSGASQHGSGSHCDHAASETRDGAGV